MTRGGRRTRPVRRLAGGARSLLAGGALALAAVPAPLAAQLAWQVDDASVAFVIRNAGLPVRGSFEGVEAEVCFDPARPETGTLRGSVDPATIDTGIGLRDRHLQRREYFDVERYGRIELRSLRLERAGEDFEATFLLRIRDVEREVVIPFSFEDDGRRGYLAGKLALDRLAYGLGKPSLILGDEVTVEVALVLVRGGGEAPAGACHRSPAPSVGSSPGETRGGH